MKLVYTFSKGEYKSASYTINRVTGYAWRVIGGVEESSNHHALEIDYTGKLSHVLILVILVLIMTVSYWHI